MTDARTPSQAGTLPPAGLRRVLAVLCLTELASWGVLYYAFPVLSVSISNDTGWSPQTIMAAFSIGQLIAALTGIPVGRIIDRIGPRAVMTAGSVLAVPGLVLVAVAQNLPTFYAGWFIAGIAMGAVLYPPAFAAVTRWYGERYVKALTVLTLVAGLASTVFAPLAATLGERTDWRTAYLILAGMLAAITIPRTCGVYAVSGHNHRHQPTVTWSITATLLAVVRSSPSSWPSVWLHLWRLPACLISYRY